MQPKKKEEQRNYEIRPKLIVKFTKEKVYDIIKNILDQKMEEMKEKYNHETALAWLEQMKDSWRKQDYFKYRRALFELDDLLSIFSL